MKRAARLREQAEMLRRLKVTSSVGNVPDETFRPSSRSLYIS